MAKTNVMENVAKLRSMQKGSEKRDPKAGKFFGELYTQSDPGSRAERALSLADRFGRQRQIGAFKKEMAKEHGKGTKDYDFVTKYAKRSGK